MLQQRLKTKSLHAFRLNLRKKNAIIAQQQEKIKEKNSEIVDLQEEVELSEIETNEEALDFDEGAHPWSTYMKRLPHNVLSPTPTTIPKERFLWSFCT